jgi:phage FluMu protein Com
MPIRFRCPHCNKLLGIATRKAGTDIGCPQCAGLVTVPNPVGDGPTPKELDEIDEILGLTGPEPAAPVAAPPRPQVKAAPPPAPKPTPAPKKQKKPGDSLFETGDVDELLGLPSQLPPVEDDATPAPTKGGPKPVSGMDVQSLDGGDGAWVVSPKKAAVVVVAVVLLLLVAFGGGFLIASRL